MTKKVPALIVGLAVASLTAGAAGLPHGAGGPQSQSSGASGSRSSGKSSGTTKKKTSSKKRRTARREPTQKAPTPDRILEIQSSLGRAGYYKGEPNGKWDASTIDAMQKFQSDNGLEPTGKLDALSLQKLGLGSSVAGVSAPKPVTPQQAAPANAPGGTPPPSTPSAAPTSAPSKQGTPKASSEGTAAESASSAGPAPASAGKTPHQ